MITFFEEKILKIISLIRINSCKVVIVIHMIEQT